LELAVLAQLVADPDVRVARLLAGDVLVQGRHDDALLLGLLADGGHRRAVAEVADDRLDALAQEAAEVRVDLLRVALAVG
jgi:hypothetical protein